MRRKRQNGPDRRHRIAGTLRRPLGFGVRLALLAVLAQAIIPVVHHIHHGYPLVVVAAAADNDADSAQTENHRHDPAKKHAPPVPDNRTPACPVCQSAQQLTATLPPAAAPLFMPPQQDDDTRPARDSAAAAAPPCSPAQPRAPPPLIA
jgi:hypothetical protein